METITIIVNGRPKPWLKKFKTITLEQLTMLSFGNLDYGTTVTCTYSNGRKKAQGSMVKGDKVNVSDGMIFNLIATNRA